MVELRISAQNLNDLQMGLAVVFKQPGSLNPPEELERMLPAPSAVQYIPHKVVVEFGYQIPDRVL